MSDVSVNPEGTVNSGIGGWLLLLVVSLTFLNPGVTIYNLYTGYREAHTIFYLFPGLRTTFIIDIILSAAMMSFSLYAGISLWRIKPKAVRVAKKYMTAAAAYALVGAVLPFLAGLPARDNESIVVPGLVQFFQTLIYVGVWASYLNKSKRVASTYRSAN
jgi:hypothetical protein